MEEITQTLDKGEDVDVIFLDFAKAFDKVPQQRLLQKLSAYGIKRKVHKWIKDYQIENSGWASMGYTLNGENLMLPREYLKEVFWDQFSPLYLLMTCQRS